MKGISVLKWVDALIRDPAFLLLAQTAGAGSKTAVPSLFGPGTGFTEDHSSMDWGWGMVSG